METYISRPSNLTEHKIQVIGRQTLARISIPNPTPYTTESPFLNILKGYCMLCQFKLHFEFKMHATSDIDNSLNFGRRHTGDISHKSLGSALYDSKKIGVPIDVYTP